MAITGKEFAEILGLKDFDETKATSEEVKSFLDEKFVSREHAPKDEKIKAAVFGKTVGEMRNKIKQLGEFDPKDVEGKDIVPLLDMLNEKYTTQLTAAKESGSVGKDKKVADLEKLIEDKDKSLKAYKEGLDEKEAKINEITSSYENNLKSYKTNDKLEKIKANIPFVDDYSKKEVLRTGFESIINSKFKFNLNEKEELEVFTADGNPIKHPKKTGEFLKADELIYQIAEEQGLVKKNNATNEKKPFFIPNLADVSGQNGQQKSKVHSKARANAERVA